MRLETRCLSWEHQRESRHGKDGFGRGGLQVIFTASGYPRAGSWLCTVVLWGLAATTLSGLGSYKPFVYLIVVLVLIQAAQLALAGRVPPAALGLLLLTPATLVVCDLVAPGGISDRNDVRNVIAFAAVACSVWMLPTDWGPRGRRSVYLVAVATLALISIAHAVTLWLFLEPHGPMGNPQLLHENPHFISLEATVAGLVSVHAWYSGGASRWLALVTVAAVLAIVVLLGSVMATLSLGIAGIVVIAAHLSLRWRLVLAGVAVLLAFAVLIYPMIPDRFEIPLEWIMEEVGASRPDARFELWSDAWRLQLQSNGVEWLLGHGLQGFATNYPDIWVFPHHFPLEVLYNSGLVGLTAFIVAVAALVIGLWRSLRPGRGTLLLSVALLCAVGVFTFLTLPLTSRVTAHALGFCIGFWLWARKSEQDTRAAELRSAVMARSEGAG